MSTNKRLQHFRGRWRASSKPLPPIDLWIHTPSIGEIKPLVPLLLESNRRIGITVTSDRSIEAVRQQLADHCQVKLLPLPTSPAIQQLRRNWQPQRLVLLEADAWPHLLSMAGTSISELAGLAIRVNRGNQLFWRHSFKQLNNVDFLHGIWVETDQERDRLKKCGCPAAKVQTGYFSKLMLQSQNGAKKTLPRLPEKEKQHRIVVGSIHKEEISVIAKAIQIVSQKEVSCEWVIVPRYPAEAETQAKLFRSAAVNTALWPEQHAVTLVSEFGVLEALYATADVSLVGGSWTDLGGHNPVEPLLQNTATIMGPSVYNQEALLNKLGENAVTIAPDAPAIADAIDKTLNDHPNGQPIKERIHVLGQAAQTMAIEALFA